MHYKRKNGGSKYRAKRIRKKFDWSIKGIVDRTKSLLQDHTKEMKSPDIDPIIDQESGLTPGGMLRELKLAGTKRKRIERYDIKVKGRIIKVEVRRRTK